MFSLFSEVKFWTLKNDVQIRGTDFGAFRYCEKKDVNKSDCYASGKENYARSRGNPAILRNRRSDRVKSALRELEQILHNQQILWVDWRPEGCLQLVLSSGLIVNIRINLQAANLDAIRFDRFLVGKVFDVSDVICTKSHVVFSHAENQLTLVYLVKPQSKCGPIEKLQKLDPKVQVVELAGPAGRRLNRHLSANTTGDLLLTWWQTSRHEVYPWTPNMKDRDRANVHLYNLAGIQIELTAYFRTESDPLCVLFSRTRHNILLVLEQKVSRKGDVTVESTCFQVVKRSLVKKAIISIPLQTHVSCHAFSPNEDRLALGCIDGSLVLLDEARGVTRQVRAAFIPTLLSWHNDGALLLAANDRGQFQWFDLALSCVRAQLLSEDVTPSNLLDLGSYFTSQPTLLKMYWSCKESVPYYSDKFVPNDNFLLLAFEGGPLAILTLVGGGGLIGDIYSCGLTPDSLIRMYTTWQQIDRAISLLLSLDWNLQGAQCLAGLYHISNAIFRAPLTAERENQLETALGSFHAPVRPLTSEIMDEFADQVHDLTRRFFHQLVRYQLFEKAFCLALDLGDRDLYLDLLTCARRLGDRDMAHAIKEQLVALNSDASSCSCDGSSDGESLPPLPCVKKPPLPEFSRFGKLRESAFFTRTQTSFTMIPEEPAADPSNNAPGSSPPGVIEQLYDLPAKSRASEKLRGFTATPPRNFLTDFGKPLRIPSVSTVPTTSPYHPSTSSFSAALPPSFAPTPTPLVSCLTPSIAPYPNSRTLTSIIGNSTATAFSPVLGPGTSSNSSSMYPANPLSSHLYGVASKAEQKPANAPTKQKVKFSDTVTQIVVPDISQLSGGKTRRMKSSDNTLELPNSLPMCLGTPGYLKENSKSRDDDEEHHGSTIKVIHFGVV